VSSLLGVMANTVPENFPNMRAKAYEYKTKGQPDRASLNSNVKRCVIWMVFLSRVQHQVLNLATVR
jgi:hypothetical protein